ncbi:MAG: glutathione synthase [Gammaproteobacteria bacterium]|nr:glutathione synthase [Gammaproteobacteria bacterium]
MNVNIGIVMDPIESITPYKDSTLAMMLAAQEKGWTLWYMQQQDLYLVDGVAHARRTRVEVADDNQTWYQAIEEVDTAMHELDIVLMRKDPPFNMDYIYSTYILERAEAAGVLVSNKPSSLRDVNEKLFTAWFAEHCPTTTVTMQSDRIKAFLEQHKDIIVKPLDGMGGESIFRIRSGDPNLNVILETITQRNTRQTMAQTFLPEISEGDKRVLVVDGEPMPFTLARIPTEGESRGNLAAGGRGVPMPLTSHERTLVAALRDELLARDLLFVGVDVIGTHITEINVTSPTCIRELEAHADLGIANRYMQALEQRLTR